MAVGIVKHGQWASAVAKGAGNPVMIVGSATGRDGIHGATFASVDISEESEAKRPSVQVGDPFTEKLLLEASLEAIHSGYLVGIQDMGAAGITCSTSEMSAKGKSGMRIYLEKVPARELGMTAYELMLSESQERMLVVVKKGCEDQVKSIFAKWDLHAEIIGEVIGENRLVVSYHDETVADVPADSLVLGGGAPVYIREASEPEYLKSTRAFSEQSLEIPKDFNAILLSLLRSPSLSSKRWVYEQYDGMVRTNNVVSTASDSAVVLIKEIIKALSLKTDCNSRYVYLNPRRGGMIAVAEAARNVACTGARPLAITNCLNFGNPYKPEVYWQFKEAVAGIAEACRSFDTPVTGGNVSFYNESPTGAIYPTPVIGMLGLVEDVSKVVTSAFKDEGDIVLLFGKTTGQIGGSEYLALVHKMVAGEPPAIDLETEKRLQLLCLRLVDERLLKSMHDCSEGGIAVTLAECAIADEACPIGAAIRWDSRSETTRDDFLLFGEDQSRIVVSTDDTNVQRILTVAEEHGVPSQIIGRVGGDRLIINDQISLSIGEMLDACRFISNTMDS
jgi:phosphoribosylformylglycinamidine synthase